jgi:hypothetical protein
MVSGPTPTGSSSHGVPASRAAEAAARMPSARAGVIVPVLTTSAPATAASSAASAWSSTIAGEAPRASSALAERFVATRLVTQCTSGVSSWTVLRSELVDAVISRA